MQEARNHPLRQGAVMPDVRLISDTGRAVTVAPARRRYYLRQGFRPEGGGDIVRAADKAVLAERRAGQTRSIRSAPAFHGFLSGATFAGQGARGRGLGSAATARRLSRTSPRPTRSASLPAPSCGARARRPGSILKALPAGAPLMGGGSRRSARRASAWRKIRALAKAGRPGAPRRPADSTCRRWRSVIATCRRKRSWPGRQGGAARQRDRWRPGRG